MNSRVAKRMSGSRDQVLVTAVYDDQPDLARGT